MFKSAATGLAHRPTVRAVVPENPDLKPIKDVIATLNDVLQSIQRLSTDFVRSTDALRTWAGGEGEDLEDTFSACATLLNHWISSLASFAGNIEDVLECLKAVRTKEEMLAEMCNLHELHALDAEIVDEKFGLGDWKRVRAREWMGVLFGGLLECSEKGRVVATFGRDIIEYVPTEMPHSDLQYSGHSGVKSLVTEAEQTLYETSSGGEVGNGTLQNSNESGTSDVPRSSSVPGRVSSFDQSPSASSTNPFTQPPQSGTGFNPSHEPGPSTEQELHSASFVGEIGDGSLQLPNESQIVDTHGPQLSLSSLPDQQEPTEPPPPYTLSALPIDPPSNPHELGDSGEHNTHSQSETYTPAQQTRLPPPGEPLPASPARSNPFLSLPPPGRSGLTGNTPGLPSSSSTPPIQPTSAHRFTQRLAAADEWQIRLDAELAKQLQVVDDASRSYTDAPGVQGADGILDSEIARAFGMDTAGSILTRGTNDKGKGKDQTEVSFFTPAISHVSSPTTALSGTSKALYREHPISNLYPICGICLAQFQVTHSPISAALAANSSARLPFGLRLPCPGEHTYCISCLAEYIERKLNPSGAEDANTHITVFPIPCPECPIMDWESGIQDDVAEKVFDAESMSVWHHRKLLDSLPRRYCPNPNCSVLVQIDPDYANPNAQCPACFQWVCVPCKAMWHQDMTCEEYQSLSLNQRSPEDQLAIELAKSRRWRRCPGCHAITERTLGYNHIKCLCRMEFCFNCGSLWCTRRGTCSNDPPCELLDERMLLGPSERERADNADNRPPAQARPAPRPPSVLVKRRPAPPPPPTAPTRRRPAPPPPPPGVQHRCR